ncbi:esterase/lipase family protein [Acidihalobacter prosperus]
MREAVITLHGLWMTGLEMSVLRSRLQQQGYAVYPFHYPSVRRSPRENAQTLRRFVEDIDAEVVHFVAHSLGGIVVLHLFDLFPLQRPGRAVFLGTPLNGSQAARHVAHWPLIGRFILGASLVGGLQGSVPTWHAGRELGMVSGIGNSIGIGHLFGGPLPQPHDGTVAFRETQAPYVSSYLEVHSGHFGLLFRKEIAESIGGFLREGTF